MVSVSITNVLAFVSPILKNQRLTINNQEPALGMANSVLQGLLAAPLRYRFNRKTLTINISESAGCDYVVAVDDLGWIEQQWLTNTTGTPEFIGLDGAVALRPVSTVKRPTQMCPLYDDNEGNITFRFDATPEQPYTANIDYQMKATYITSVADTFGPVPDEFGMLYRKWMLSEGALLLNDSRAPIFRRDAVYATLALQDGLSEQARVMMLEQMLNFGLTTYRAQAMGQAGAKGRIGQ